MAEVHIVDIDGEQWDIQDKGARELISNIPEGFFSVKELKITDLDRCTIPEEYKYGNGQRMIVYGMINLNCVITATSTANVYRPNTVIARIKDWAPLISNAMPSINAETSQGGIVLDKSGNDILIRAASGLNTRFIRITLTFNDYAKV